MRCHQRADQTYNRNLHERRKGNRIGDLRSIPLEHLRSELYDFIASGAFGFIECHVGVFDDFPYGVIVLRQSGNADAERFRDRLIAK